MNWAEFDRTIEEFDKTGEWQPPRWMGEPATAPAPEVAVPELPAEERTGPPPRLPSRVEPVRVPSYRTSQYASRVIEAKSFD